MKKKQCEQHEILTSKPLLNAKGELVEPGYAKSLLPIYDRCAIKAPNWRIKEWDYYFISNDKYGVALTIADNSYMGLDSITLLDFRKPWEHTKSPMQFFTGGKVGFPSSSSKGDVSHFGKHHSITFKKNPDSRILAFQMDDFFQGKPIKGEITLTSDNSESMVIATPFPKEKHFYFNQKINCMSACGSLTLGDELFQFNETDSFGVLDWGRGVWTYKNTWYWGSCSTIINNIPFGFNIGYGFGDTSAASENMIFYNGKAHKLDKVTFNIPLNAHDKEEYMKPWTFTSNDGRFEMDFHPIIDRHADSNVVLIRSNQHQVFGRFSGKAILDSGEKINVENVLGFAEKVYNKW